MTQEDDSGQSLKVAREQIFTPETFSPRWDGDPVDFLDTPLNFPYNSSEWDAIFAALIDLLGHPAYEVWETA